jgi:hypothetical protein
MPYRFEEVGEVSCDEIAVSLVPALIGCRAMNSSFDSGRAQMPGWEPFNDFSASPVITAEFVAHWPVSHDGYCDEWWVFDGSIPRDFSVNAFCNCTNMRIADYKQLDWDAGCPLDKYLERFHPKLVFGNNEFGYVITREA